MRSPRPRKYLSTSRLESLESRQVMSADPLADLLGGALTQQEVELDVPLVHHGTIDGLPPLEQHVQGPDFSIDWELQATLADQLQGIDQMLAEAHAQTGWNTVQTNYGLKGSGQTVAIIDSGIAYNHFALGGGLGGNYRVVGGWDFTEENDANPYDDGAAGSHGTHVAGIVGSDATGHKGVATDVDLVALRVFNDAGDGYFSWVDNALQWVHDNRNAFANPITTVNLSLGVSTWNSTTNPNWANLENSFAQLEADGIFISVSAGNSFANFNAPGLSYPATSSHVVPVMSTDDNGLLSYYSQRLQRAIAAPGRSIISTVPDYKGNNNGIADDFAAKSGTSMAAPYMAGASVLIREAMQFAGQSGITQSAIYNVVKSTADPFLDTATNITYDRLNLSAAIDSVMPSDDYGSTQATAHALGSLTTQSAKQVSGHIAKLNDVDVFSFTAAATGSVTFSASNLTHSLSSQWTVYNSSGQTIATGTSNEVDFDVASGQTYAVAYSTSDGLGHYQITASAESSSPTFTYTDWGTIAYNQYADIAASGDMWRRVTASQNGYLTFQATYSGPGENLTFGVYNANMQLVGSQAGAGGVTRVDVQAAAGSNYFVQILGTHNDVDFTLANLVRQNGSTVTALGTNGDDTVHFTRASTLGLNVNGLSYAFAASGVSSVVIQSSPGNDAVQLYGSNDSETVALRHNSATLTGGGFQVSAYGAESVYAYGGGGYDTVAFYDSVDDNRFIARPSFSWMDGPGFFNHASDFDKVEAFATAGGSDDRAYFYDSADNNRFVGRPTFAWMDGQGFYNYASGFDSVRAYANSGGNDDRAFLYDTVGNDLLVAGPTGTVLTGTGYYNYVSGFDNVQATASSGDDYAEFYDSPDDNRFVARPTFAWMDGPTFYNRADGFDAVKGYATAGGNNDRAFFYDSAGDDRFVGRPQFSWMDGPGFFARADGFDSARAYATAGGNDDRAFLYDSAGDDLLGTYPTFTFLSGVGFYIDANNFDSVQAYADAGGYDQAFFYDSAGDDRFTIGRLAAQMTGVGFNNASFGFDEATARAASGGNDRAVFYGLTTGDVVFGREDEANVDTLTDKRRSFGFDNVRAYAAAAQTPSTDVDAIDYLFEQFGAWM